jgi:hypothetical protein
MHQPDVAEIVRNEDTGIDPSGLDTIKNTENNEDNDKNLEEIDTDPNNNDSIEYTNIPSHSHNVSQASQASQTPKMSTNQYQQEVTDPKTMCPDGHGQDQTSSEECDLRNQERADKFRAECDRLKTMWDKEDSGRKGRE